jgi:hypothetical protein
MTKALWFACDRGSSRHKHAARNLMCCRCKSGFCSNDAGCTAFTCWQGTTKQVCKVRTAGCVVSAAQQLLSLTHAQVLQLLKR